MCGILGVIQNTPIESKLFGEALDLLNHRGPDETKTMQWRNVCFGFKRLSIQDLSKKGSQPMTHPLAPIHIVFNGEIYNFKILRQELAAEGVSFYSASDTEVILQAYRVWGWEETLKRLEGMFGFAIYDEEKKVIFLARDRFGQKPLFYSLTKNGGLCFSSEIKSIIRMKGKAELSFLDCLNPLFTTGLSPKGRTMFEGVSQLEEGSYLKYSLLTGSTEIKRYFHVADLVSKELYQEIDHSSENALLKKCENVLEESVKLHLISDAPLACLFSAGVDSSVIAALAARHQPIKLYHFESEMLSCLDYAKSFAAQHKLELKIVKGEDRNFIFDLPRVIYHYETINKNDGIVLAKLCQIARQDGFKAMLAGDASDELFGGYYHAAKFAVQNSLFYSKSSRFIRLLNRAFPNNLTQFSDSNPAGASYFTSPSGMNADEVPLNCLFHRGERLNDFKRCVNTYHFVNDKAERQLLGYLLDEVSYRLQRFMIRSDRFGMMESVEIRTPFLHTDVVRLAINMPSRLRLKKRFFWRGYERKYLIKKLATRIGLTRKLAYRRKVTTPFNSDAQLRQLISKWDFSHLAQFLRIPPKTLTEIALDSFDPGLSRIQFAFISMEVLLRLFIEGQSHENISEEFKSILG